MSNVYSKLDQIPSGIAQGGLTPGCLVLEGGALRTMYSQGVLDAWMQNEINFQCVIGTSAGALSGMNYMSRQIGRSARANLSSRFNSNFIGVNSIRKAHSLIRLDFLLKDYNQIEMFNVKNFFEPERRFVAVVANCDTGERMYCDRDHCGNIMDAIKASASMPFVTPMVNVDGIPGLDGGSCCKIPFQWAIEQGYEKIVIVKTREKGFRKTISDRRPAEKIYRNHQAFATALDNSSEMYNLQCDAIDQLEEEGRLFVISPEKQVGVSRVERNIEKLGDLYWEGYDEGLAAIDRLKEYLNK